MMSRVKQGLSPTEETVVDSATGTVMSSAGTGAVCETGNADDCNYKKTIVVYNSTDSSQAQKIADLLGVGTVKKNDGTYSFTGDYLVVVGQDWK